MGRSIMMARHALVPLLVGIVLLAWASGLGQQTGEGVESATPAAVATPSVVTEVLSVLPTALPATPSPLQASVPVSAVLARYLETTPGPSGGRASWAGHIRDVAVGLNTATVRTDLGDGPADRRIAEELAAAVTRFSASPLGQGLIAPDVTVLGANPQALVNRTAAGLAHTAESPSASVSLGRRDP